MEEMEVYPMEVLEVWADLAEVEVEVEVLGAQTSLTTTSTLGVTTT